MRLLYVVGPGFTDEALVSWRLLQLPKGTVVTRANPQANARLTVWKTRPDAVWVFTEDMWKDKTHRWLDLAAEKTIPGMSINPAGENHRWGW
jgi:hypothetical protein